MNCSIRYRQLILSNGILSNVIDVIEIQKDAIGDIDEIIHLQQMTTALEMIAKLNLFAASVLCFL
jgi:hypothetical protein